MASISNKVLEQLSAALADPATGFNARAALLAVDPEYDGTAAISFDFSATSKSFMTANADLAVLIEKQSTPLPAMLIYSTGGRSVVETNRSPFEGDVPVDIDSVIEFKADVIKGDLEKPGSLFEDVMTRLLFETDWQPPVYNVGTFQWFRYPLAKGGKNMIQRIRFQVNFKVAY